MDTQTMIASVEHHTAERVPGVGLLINTRSLSRQPGRTGARLRAPAMDAS
jgi:hypothetical protein